MQTPSHSPQNYLREFLRAEIDITNNNNRKIQNHMVLANKTSLLAASMFILTAACFAGQDTTNTESPSPLRPKTEKEQATADAFVRGYKRQCKELTERLEIEKSRQDGYLDLSERELANFVAGIERYLNFKLTNLSVCLKWRKNPLQNPEEEAQCRKDAQSVYNALCVRKSCLDRELKEITRDLELIRPASEKANDTAKAS